MTQFDKPIAEALGSDLVPGVTAQITGEASLPSYFDVTGLAVASIAAAAQELSALEGNTPVALNTRHALQWFDMTLRPLGWEMLSAWDAIAGDYRTADGWIRLHTNAPHHRKAALDVLDCAADRESVARHVAEWAGQDLEEAIVDNKGCAAEMRDIDAWRARPQGRAVAQEPLIHWDVLNQLAPQLKPLSEIRILDLTRVLAGPVATRFLAGFGAQVLRIDPPGWNEAAVETEVTLGKRCAGLDLTHAADRSVLAKLLRDADVLLHGYRPGALEALGFGAEERHNINPALIDVCLNAYGWTGPWAQRRGFDSLLQMSSGIACEGMRRSGKDRPTPLPVQALDHATGYLMAAAVLRALRHSSTTGAIQSARLSLARTAHVLITGGCHPLTPALAPETADDDASEPEMTGWGPANRITFPITLDGRLPSWPLPANPLRSHAAAW